MHCIWFEMTETALSVRQLSAELEVDGLELVGDLGWIFVHVEFLEDSRMNLKPRYEVT